MRAEALKSRAVYNRVKPEPKPAFEERARILVVDDENGPRQSLRMLLKEEHDVRLASDVAAALKILEQESVNVVITDIRMPQRSGVELLQIINQEFPGTDLDHGPV